MKGGHRSWTQQGHAMEGLDKQCNSRESGGGTSLIWQPPLRAKQASKLAASAWPLGPPADGRSALSTSSSLSSSRMAERPNSWHPEQAA